VVVDEDAHSVGKEETHSICITVPSRLVMRLNILDYILKQNGRGKNKSNSTDEENKSKYVML
jgi:hypothetical protein